MRIAMNFKDGICGFKMRPEFRGKTTLELIKQGKRTATSRDFAKWYNRKVPRIGEKVIFYDKVGEEVVCLITSQPKSIREIPAEEWSLKECWSIEVYHKLKESGDYYQFEYVLA